MFAIPSNRNKSYQNITIVALRCLLVLFFISAWFDNLYKPKHSILFHILFIIWVKMQSHLSKQKWTERTFFVCVHTDKKAKSMNSEVRMLQKKNHKVLCIILFLETEYCKVTHHVDRPLNKRSNILQKYQKLLLNWIHYFQHRIMSDIHSRGWYSKTISLVIWIKSLIWII